MGEYYANSGGAMRLGMRLGTPRGTTPMLPPARFEVTPNGVAIPRNPAELKSNLSHLEDVSAESTTSKKFQGRDSSGPVRVRVEKAHPNDPSFNGTPDPLHNVDHVHIDRRAKGETGPWKSTEKAPYGWPF
jgi:hypothetical protein